MMRAIQITIDEEALAAIDATPEAKARGRSAFVRAAVHAYLRQQRQSSIDDAYRRGYGGGVRDEEIGPWEEAQAWPEE
jgi:metal-responsive CopG/Arc/MetJ family transcriptional regulator